MGYHAPGYHRAGALRQMDVTKVGLSGAGRECWHGRMRLALLSDIHANLPALEACLAAAQALGAERLVFLGDFVGYGPDPEAVVRRVQPLIASGAIGILGNHDAATFQGDSSMNSMAAAAIAWTRQQLSPDSIAFLKSLPLEVNDGAHMFVHADASNPSAWNYVTDAEMAEAAQTVAEMGLVPLSAAGSAERDSWMADCADAGIFGRRDSANFARSPDWRTEADRIIAASKIKDTP